MCGIFGIQPALQIPGKTLQAMSGALRHRGPDDEGFLTLSRDAQYQWAGPETPTTVRAAFGSNMQVLSEDVCLPVGSWSLGHRRLSILDLSAAGHQPMPFNGRFWIVYNGEVYNYIELRDELRNLGHQFHSGGDTEVILAAYAQWGPDCLSKFNGMWGLAIADLEKRVLFLARDRFGVKPLYLRSGPSGVAFASEIKAFTVLPDWRPRANLSRVMEFLVWELSDHTRETMFDDVYQLLPGHHLTLPLDRLPSPAELLAAVRWYSPVAQAGVCSEDASERLRVVLAEAVRLRLRADVPVGSCLSGGLDSSAIVALMARQLRTEGATHQQMTITARSHDPNFDESHQAQRVIDATGVRGIFTTPNPDDLFANLDRLVWHQDEPFVSTSIFAQWCVFKAAKENGLTVMLDGQGADESLGGYRGFFGARLAGLVRRGQLRAWAGDLLAMRREIGFPLRRSIGYTLAYSLPQFRGLFGRFDNRAFSDLSWLMPRVRTVAADDPSIVFGGRSSSVRNMSVAMLTATNLPMLLRWEDRNSMAASIEARVPFLDYRVVELALGMDDSVKVGGGVTKRVLREAMRGLVPDAILDRRDKMGFVTAERTWMTRDRPQQFRECLAASIAMLPGIVDHGLLKTFDEVVAGRRPFDHRFWRVIALGTWVRRFAISFD